MTGSMNAEQRAFGNNQRTGSPMWTTWLAFRKKVCQSIIFGAFLFIFTREQVYIDWLHAADLGVSQLFLGSLYTLVLETIGGDKHRACKTLWIKIQNFYKVNKYQSRLKIFPAEHAQGQKNPKLRSKAGVCRDLVPFGVEIAAAHFGAL